MCCRLGNASRGPAARLVNTFSLSSCLKALGKLHVISSTERHPVICSPQKVFLFLISALLLFIRSLFAAVECFYCCNWKETWTNSGGYCSCDVTSARKEFPDFQVHVREGNLLWASVDRTPDAPTAVIFSWDISWQYNLVKRRAYITFHVSKKCFSRPLKFNASLKIIAVLPWKHLRLRS